MTPPRWPFRQDERRAVWTIRDVCSLVALRRRARSPLAASFYRCSVATMFEKDNNSRRDLPRLVGPRARGRRIALQIGSLPIPESLVIFRTIHVAGSWHRCHRVTRPVESRSYSAVARGRCLQQCSAYRLAPSSICRTEIQAVDNTELTIDFKSTFEFLIRQNVHYV